MRNPEGRWFRRLADVGIGYEGDLKLRQRLRDRDAVPEVHRYNFDGRNTVSLSWPGGTSASPVHQLGFDVPDDEPSDKLRERVLSAMELPGAILDYHFAIQRAADLLWKRRRSEPGQMTFVEWLSWWDARIVEAYPEAFEIQPGTAQFISVAALDRIINLYEHEGFLHEALAAAERFARFRPAIDTVSELRARVAQLREEDV